MALEPHHLEDLRQSGLSDETLDVCGIRSAPEKDVRRKLRRRKKLSPGIEFPYTALNGEGDFSRFKLDDPPVGKNGRPCKYLSPVGAPNHLYIAPTLYREILNDVTRDLLLTEGEKKTLAAIQAGFACIGLAGVWCWRGKNSQTGHSEPIPDLDHIAWKRRNVYIVFDSDLAENAGVRRAEWMLAQELQRRGAIVRVVRLPDGAGGQKVGLDDFLVLHGDRGSDELRRLIQEAQNPEDPTSADHPYREQGGCIGYMKLIGRGDNATEVFVPLANFVARVVEDRALDDGAEVRRHFVVDMKLSDGRRLPQIEVSAAQFASMSWVVREAGVKARIVAGQGAQDRVREAIQVFSTDVRELYAYAHTGWRKIGGRWLYLHAGRTDVQVALEPPLNRYALPEAPEDVPAAVRLSMALLKVGPVELTIPLLAAVYLAPLCEFLHLDFALALVGKTGSLKSTLSALFLCHYGNFERTSLPGSWESTDNALERLLFTLKDVIAVADDYAPRADVGTQRRQAARAQRIFRAMGNLSGRSRMRADRSLEQEHPPRGLLISTGEDLPPGQSILARTLCVEVNRDQLDLVAISNAQSQTHLLPQALAGYIDWLAPQLDEFTPELRETWRQHRERFSQQAAHLRIPEILAYLALGIDLFTSFAQDIGAATEGEMKEVATRAHQALLTLGEKHGRRVREEDPAEVFLTSLSSMLAQGTVTLARRDGGDDPLNKIGWRDTDYAYLIPDAARHAVGRYLRESDGHFPYSARAINEALNGRGALVKGTDGRSTPLVKIRGKGRRVLQIPLRLLDPDEDEGDDLGNWKGTDK
jgi:hypothetical protein